MNLYGQKKLEFNFNCEKQGLIFAIFAMSVWTLNYSENCNRQFKIRAIIGVLATRGGFGGKGLIHLLQFYLHFPNRCSQIFSVLFSQTNSFSNLWSVHPRKRLCRCANSTIRLTVT